MRNRVVFSLLITLLVSQLFSLNAFSQDAGKAVVCVAPHVWVSGTPQVVDIVIENSQNVAGYQVMLQFNSDFIEYFSLDHGDYLPNDAFFGEPQIIDDDPNDSLKLLFFAATSLTGESSGDGTLATIKFKQIGAGSPLTLLDETLLSDRMGKTSSPMLKHSKTRPFAVADLAVRSVQASPINTTKGERNYYNKGEVFDLRATVRNVGSRISYTKMDSLPKLRFYGPTFIDTEKGNELGAVNIEPLEPNQAAEISLPDSVTAPEAPGVYYYTVCIEGYEGYTDSKSGVDVTDNNCHTLEITVGKPNMVLTTVAVDPGIVFPGDTFELAATVKNEGEISSATLRFYGPVTASTIDALLPADFTDKALREAVYITSLPPNGTSKSIIIVTAPVVPGTYYYGVSVKSGPNESNIPFSAVRITVQPTVNIPDLKLREVIESKLGKAPGEVITPADMLTIEVLHARGKMIEHLIGLESAINLTELYLFNNNISDVSPLTGLKNLKELELANNEISDMTPLAGLINLTKLYLYNNKISDLRPLRHLKNLEWLKLENNQIIDVTPLKDLASLTALLLLNNDITDVTPLKNLVNLTTLNLSNNDITDVTPLAGLKNLEKLHLANNRILDVSPLAGLTQMRELHLDNNPILDMSPIMDLKNRTVHFNKSYETTNEYGSTVYYYPDGSNKVVLIKGLKLEDLSQKGINNAAKLVNGMPDFNDQNPDFTYYLPYMDSQYFKIYPQVENHTCGHASALMLLHYYGVKFSQNNLRKNEDEDDIFDGLARGSESNQCGDIVKAAYPNLNNISSGLCNPLFSKAFYKFGPGTLPHEEVIGLKNMFPFSTDQRTGISGRVFEQKNFLENLISESRPPIIFLKLKEYFFHWVLLVGYDTKANMFLIADPSVDPSRNDVDKFKWWEWTNQPACGPALEEAWGLHYTSDHVCPNSTAWEWRVGGFTADLLSTNAGTQYFAVFPTEAPPYHHLESQTLRIRQSNRNGKWIWPIIRRNWKVIDCKWFFFDKENTNVSVNWTDKEITISGENEVDMFLTVYYEQGAPPAPSIVPTASSINTVLLPNYPNPFNPETWIPYQLAKPANVKLTIYDIRGHVVRNLDLGHQRAGIYQNRTRAAHWDGKNAVGEHVASGVYFYTLQAGDYSATRKMLIRK